MKTLSLRICRGLIALPKALLGAGFWYLQCLDSRLESQIQFRQLNGKDFE